MPCIRFAINRERSKLHREPPSVDFVSNDQLLGVSTSGPGAAQRPLDSNGPLGRVDTFRVRAEGPVASPVILAENGRVV